MSRNLILRRAICCNTSDTSKPVFLNFQCKFSKTKKNNKLKIHKTRNEINRYVILEARTQQHFFIFQTICITQLKNRNFFQVHNILRQFMHVKSVLGKVYLYIGTWIYKSFCQSCKCILINLKFNVFEAISYSFSYNLISILILGPLIPIF